MEKRNELGENRPRIRSQVLVRGGFFLGLFAVLALVSVSLAWSKAQLRQKKDEIRQETEETPLYLPDAKYIRLVTLGFDTFWSRILWFNTVNYFGKQFLADSDYRWLYHNCKLVTQLDERATHAFEFCGTLLSWMAREPERSNEILTHAIQAHPDAWRFRYLRGFNYWYFLSRRDLAKEDFRIGSTLPEAPPVLASLATRLMVAEDDPQTAIAFLVDLIENTKDEHVKQALGEKLKRAVINLEGRKLCRPEQYKAIGYLPEHPYFYDHLTVYETLDFFASLHEITQPERARRIRETLGLVGLADRAKSPVRALSKGLKQRLGFAQAMINKPELLLLDEPFSGLDPLGRAETRNLVMDLKKKGTTIFLSSHILSDVEHICDRVGIMARGDLKRVFSLEETPSLFGQSFELGIRVGFGLEDLAQHISENAVSRRQKNTLSGTVHLLEFSNYDQATKCMKDALTEGLQIVSFRSSGPSLEDIFVDITLESQKGPGDLKDL